jgi:hypothetical protein
MCLLGWDNVMALVKADETVVMLISHKPRFLDKPSFFSLA